MVTADTLHPEGPRYTARLLFVPGLWAEPSIWRGFASFLAHRGWECHLLDVRAEPGGLASRATAVAAYAEALAAPVVLIGHDAGALTALVAAARRVSQPACMAAVVLVAPLVPGGRRLRALVRSPRAVVRLLAGRPLPPPRGPAAVAAWGDLPPAAARALGPDDGAAVRDVVWNRVSPAPVPGVPTLVLGGDRDPLLPPPAAAALARTLGADRETLAGAGHWPLVEPAWRDAVGVIHRWVVTRLGAPLLELYPEAMAEREAEGDDEP